MAWIDCMRWRRNARILRAIGWTGAGLIGSGSAAATFAFDTVGLAEFALSVGVSLLLLALTHTIGWLADRHGDRLVKR